MHLPQHLTTFIALLGASGGVMAHDGHRMTGAHWHATDAYGFAVVAVLAAAAIWLSRRD